MKSPYKLDPSSDRFRICPECATSHMVSHRTRLFCSDKCADEYHNRKKRNEPELKPSSNPDNPKNLSESPIQVIKPQISIRPSLERNIEILSNLAIDPDVGTEYHLEKLMHHGLVLDFHSGRGKLFNIDTKLNCHFIQIGRFKLYRTAYSKILIHAEN